MKEDNRVLGRKGARELTPAEAERVIGALAIQTLTLCTVPLTGYFDGDPGECA